MSTTVLGLPADLLVYADETTFDVWSPPSRVWQSAGLLRQTLSGVALSGARSPMWQATIMILMFVW